MILCRYPSCLMDCGCQIREAILDELWEPVDPNDVDKQYLRDRLFVYLYTKESAPEIPVPPGRFICFICRRQGDMADFEMTQEECRRRFGEVALEDQLNICDDCNNIISNDLGIPL